ncbi:MAG: hypothetical protein ACTSQ7_10610 [Alphaproteobacteria bacterium]
MRACGMVLAALSLMTASEVLAASAQATADCPGDPGIDHDIGLKIDIPEPRLHHDLSIAQLDRMAPHGPRQQVLGLAEAGLEFGWSVRFEWQQRGAGYCFWVRRTELAIRQPSPDIYVAREYRRGSCAYRAILTHERQHMSISRDQINRYLPRLRWVLTSLRIPTGERPVFVTSAEAAKAEARALMKELAEPLFQEMAQALRAEQAKLDSPASYRRLRKQCKRW